MAKASKEAKVHTSWINANVEYDQAVRDFVHGILPESVPDDPFLSELQTLARRVAWFGYWNGLSQVLLKVASPGVPDFYQGSELWDLNLVDPDNRRPVDFARRRELLRELAEAVTRQSGDRRALARDLLAAVADGRIKLYVTWQALTFRRDHERLFAEGDYIPLEAAGAKKDHVCAFMRKRDGATALVVVPRLVAGLTGGAEQPPLGPAWDDTWLLLPPEERGQTYRQQFTGETFVVAERDGGWGLPLSAVLGTFPLALLGRVTAGQDGAAPAR
jgi:(1->4)-alpha-D-glucan 1-alpha-D-glucosylmutase